MGWLLRIPVLCDLHSDVRFHGAVRNFCERLTARLPAQYVAVSQTVRDAFLREMRGVVPPDAVHVIYNGVDVDEIAQQAESRADLLHRHPCLAKIQPGAFVLGAVGRLEPIKRYDLLLEAFDMLRKWFRVTGAQAPHLVIVGTGLQEKELKELAKRYSPGLTRGPAAHIHFIGWQDNVYPYYSFFDCTVFSSDSEGISFALLESLACGTPVVTTHTQREHEVIQSRDQGVVVAAGDARKLASGIEYLWHKLYGATSVKDKNIAFVKENFARSSMVAHYHALYELLCNGNGASPLDQN
jgi:glycosyltransferase involved in cell wall biosynthesis